MKVFFLLEGLGSSKVAHRVTSADPKPSLFLFVLVCIFCVVFLFMFVLIYSCYCLRYLGCVCCSGFCL